MIDDQAARALKGNVDAWRAVARATGRTLIDEDGALTYFSGASTPNFNPTVVYEPLREPKRLMTDRREMYAERGIAFGVEIPDGFDERSEQAALDLGLKLHLEQPVMVLSPVPDIHDPAAGIVEVDEDTLDEQLVAQAAGFGDGVEDLRAFTPPALLSAGRMFLARDNGEGVATSLVCVTGQEAGVFGVSTVPSHRRRGLGRAVTAAAVRAAAEAGVDFVYLHASEMGAPVYAAMGFRTVGTVRIYTDS